MESSALIDLRCPVAGLVEPDRELREVIEDLEAVGRLRRATTTEV
jgi:hypothetical protein